MNLQRTSKSVFSTAVKMIVYLVLVIVLVLFAKRGFEFGSDIFSESGIDAEPGIDVKFVLTGKESKMDVANMLYEAGLVKDKNVYFVQSLIYEAKYVAGEYTLNTSMNGEALATMLSTKKTEEAAEDESTGEQATEEQTSGEQNSGEQASEG